LPSTHPIRWLLYLWALPTTALGLLVVFISLLTGGQIQIVDGVLEVQGGFATFLLQRCVPLQGSASAKAPVAMTLGHVVIGQDANMLALTRSHERVHVRQVERWGPLFIPLYLLFSLIALLRGRDAYRDNPFEREAYERSN
jgi:hypothetical protein